MPVLPTAAVVSVLGCGGKLPYTARASLGLPNLGTSWVPPARSEAWPEAEGGQGTVPLRGGTKRSRAQGRQRGNDCKYSEMGAQKNY